MRRSIERDGRYLQKNRVEEIEKRAEFVQISVQCNYQHSRGQVLQYNVSTPTFLDNPAPLYTCLFITKAILSSCQEVCHSLLTSSILTRHFLICLQFVKCKGGDQEEVQHYPFSLPPKRHLVLRVKVRKGVLNGSHVYPCGLGSREVFHCNNTST